MNSRAVKRRLRRVEEAAGTEEIPFSWVSPILEAYKKMCAGQASDDDFWVVVRTTGDGLATSALGWAEARHRGRITDYSDPLSIVAEIVATPADIEDEKRAFAALQAIAESTPQAPYDYLEWMAANLYVRALDEDTVADLRGIFNARSRLLGRYPNRARDWQRRIDEEGE